jgi:hypothetical protein
MKFHTDIVWSLKMLCFLCLTHQCGGMKFIQAIYRFFLNQIIYHIMGKNCYWMQQISMLICHTWVVPQVSAVQFCWEALNSCKWYITVQFLPHIKANPSPWQKSLSVVYGNTCCLLWGLYTKHIKQLWFKGFILTEIGLYYKVINQWENAFNWETLN